MTKDKLQLRQNLVKYGMLLLAAQPVWNTHKNRSTGLFWRQTLSFVLTQRPFHIKVYNNVQVKALSPSRLA